MSTSVWNQNLTHSLTEWVSEWQGHLLSCPGQLKKILLAFWKCRLFARFVVIFLMFFIIFWLFDYSWTNWHEILALCLKLKVNTAYIMTCFVVTNCCRVGKPPIVGYFDPNDISCLSFGAFLTLQGDGFIVKCVWLMVNDQLTMVCTGDWPHWSREFMKPV